jgi:carboxypeptidase C (cathepsin A)
VKGKVAGYAKSAGNLELRTFNNAGHLVPMDQGEAALQALN